MKSDRADYYAQSGSWAQDVNGTLRASRQRAYVIAGAAVAVALLEAVALAALVPLKTVVPYTITVDRQTGAIETAQGIRPGALSQDMAVVQAFLAQYVLARETFDVTDLQHNYREVAAWSSGPARDQYIASMQKTNPQAPENVYDPTTIMKIAVRSISLLSKNTALVRFDAERSANSGAPSSRMPYAAVIAFQFTGTPMLAEDRYLNPLGFQVTSYRRDAETLAPVPVASAQASR